MTTKNIFKNFLSFSSVQGLSSIGGMIYSFFIAKFLGPEILGIVRTAQLSENYSELSSLGLPFALRREIPQLLGEGEEEYVKKISNVVFSYGLLAYFVSTLLVLCISFFVENEILSYALAVFSMIVFLKAFNSFGNIMAKGLNDYKFLSKMELIKPVILVSSIPLVYYYGIDAVLWTHLVIAIILSFFYYRHVPYGYKWQIDWNIIRNLLFTGLPIFFTSISALVFTSMDRFIIALFSVFENVGYYSVGSMVSIPISIIISTSSIVIFTGLNKKYGKKVNEKIILNHMEEPIKLLSLMIPLIIGIGILWMPIVINVLLPEYSESIVVGQVLAISIYFQLSASFASNAMFVMDKQKQTAYLFFFVGVVNTLLNIAAMSWGYGIFGVALATCISYIFYNLILVSLVLRNLRWSIRLIGKKLIMNQTPFILQMFMLFLVYFNISDLNSFSILLQFTLLYVVSTSIFWLRGTKQILMKVKK